MALVLTREIDLNGTPTTFYAYGSEPVENETTDDRASNVVVSFTDLAGNPITVRNADTLAEVSTLTSSAVNGRLPSFYSTEGGLVMVTSVDAQIRWSPGYVNLVGALDAALAEVAANHQGEGGGARDPASAAQDADWRPEGRVRADDDGREAADGRVLRGGVDGEPAPAGPVRGVGAVSPGLFQVTASGSIFNMETGVVRVGGGGQPDVPAGQVPTVEFDPVLVDTSEVLLSWTGAGASSWLVTCGLRGDGSSITEPRTQTLPGRASSVTFRGLEPSGDYRASIVGSNSAGSSVVDVIDFTTPAVIPTPVGFTVTLKAGDTNAAANLAALQAAAAAYDAITVTGGVTAPTSDRWEVAHRCTLVTFAGGHGPGLHQGQHLGDRPHRHRGRLRARHGAGVGGVVRVPVGHGVQRR